MEWLRLLVAFGLVFLASFGAFFLSAAWERRRRRDAALDRLIALLPGFDCGLCGAEDCRRYARRLLEGADPSLCAPGGLPAEGALRAALGGERETRRIALVRCGGNRSAAKPLFAIDGCEDCAAAARLFSGQLRCKSACLGLASCAKACPLGAIRVAEGLASVDPERCSGCGACLAACPQGLIALVPEANRWFVACAAGIPAEERVQHCSAACSGCGECVRVSAVWEFTLQGDLAVASTTVKDPGSSAYAGIAARCPTGAIKLAGGEKKR
ncbi:MAG: 4Fe-4S binding protein [Spirochaetaceae bacterium]|nr:4Fe-4S binding protein [Spirochaetaceae bacterium]